MADVYDLIQQFPEYAEKSLSSSPDLPEEYRTFDKIVFAGMGGSGISADIVKDWLSPDCPVPVVISKGYDLPECADKDSLVFAVSYSGNTQETLSSLVTAMERGCKIIGVASGGGLAEVMERNKLPLIRVPQDIPPRNALPCLFFPIAQTLVSLGLKKNGEVTSAIRIMKRQRKETEKAAQELADELADTFPFIYGTIESVCMRWKSQLNETAKMHAKYDLLPELNHNEIVGWQGNSSTKMSVIILNSDPHNKLFAKNMTFLKQVVREKAKVVEIFSRGKTMLEHVFYLIHLGDYVSYYLALKNNEDPADIRHIDNVKKYLFS